MIIRLLLIKLQALRGSFRAGQEGRHRIPVFLFLSSFFWYQLFYWSGWLARQALEIPPVGELLIQKLLSITFLVFLGLLSFSNIVTTFSTFYLADELQFLNAQPIPKDKLFASRFLEALGQSSWVLFVFGLPIFFGVGSAVQAPWYFYISVLVILVPFVAIPTAVAAIVSLGVTNVLAADRSRDAFMFVGIASFAILFVVIRAMRPEQLLNPDSFESIGEAISLLSAPSSIWLPSDWCMQIILPLLWGDTTLNLHAYGLLFITPIVLFFVATWLYRKHYIRGYSKSQEGRHGTSVVTRIRDWVMARENTHRNSLEERLNKLANETQVVSTLKQLIKKDRTIFIRDPSQWSQILIVFSILVIYLVNYKYFEIAADEKLFGEAGLFYFNLVACGFVIVALGGRFLYPSVSLEGRSFWLIMQAPVSLERFMIGKLLGGILPTLIVGQFLIWASNLLVYQNIVFCLIASVIVFVITISSGAMAVGFGAIYPQFHNPNSAKISSSFGAVIYMITGMIVILGMVVLVFRFTLNLGQGFDSGIYLITLKQTLFVFLGLLFPLFVGALTMRFGVLSLNGRF